VDEEPGVRKLLRNVLAGAGYHVFEADDGREAVRQVESSEIDLVIMDLAMPVQDGIETIQALRRVRPRLRIIAMVRICLLRACSKAVTTFREAPRRPTC